MLYVNEADLAFATERLLCASVRLEDVHGMKVYVGPKFSQARRLILAALSVLADTPVETVGTVHMHGFAHEYYRVAPTVEPAPAGRD